MKRPCPHCGSTEYFWSRWKDNQIIKCSDCPDADVEWDATK